MDLVSRPPTPAPSPTLLSRYIDGDTDMEEQGVDKFLEKGKARARDGELVGPDLRRHDSVDNGKLTRGTLLYRADK